MTALMTASTTLITITQRTDRRQILEELELLGMQTLQPRRSTRRAAKLRARLA
jgi:hypothetical protein